MREGRLIGQETEDAMLELHRLPDGSYIDAGYSRMALGWWVRDIAGNRCASHLGHTGSAFFHCDDFAVIVLSNLTNGYEMLGDQGIPASVRHGIAERAVEIFLNDGEH